MRQNSYKTRNSSEIRTYWSGPDLIIRQSDLIGRTRNRKGKMNLQETALTTVQEGTSS